MLSPFFLFFISCVLAIPMILSGVLSVQQALMCVVPGVVIYCTGLYRDVTSTVSFGSADMVRHIELSPVFSYMCRYGYGTAISVHIAIEMILVFVILPVLLMSFHDVMYIVVSIMSLYALGGIHWIGGIHNDRLALNSKLV